MSTDVTHHSDVIVTKRGQHPRRGSRRGCLFSEEVCWACQTLPLDRSPLLKPCPLKDKTQITCVTYCNGQVRSKEMNEVSNEINNVLTQTWLLVLTGPAVM